MKTEVEKYLDDKKIPYTSLEFSERPSGEEEIPVFKTLVLKGNKTDTLVALVPLNERVSYKKLAKITGNRKVGLPPIEYVLSVTGYPHGANTPIGIHMHLPEVMIVADERINQYESIVVSAGELGKGLSIKSQDLQELVQPVIASILND